MKRDDTLTELAFTIAGRIAGSCAEVYEAVANPEQLSRYFTTGGARGRLEPGEQVKWDFADFPGDFPVTVIDAEPPHRIVIEWSNEATISTSGITKVVFEFEPIDGDSRTLVTITETSWRPTAEGAEAAFGNCEGWTLMLAGLKAWLEHGINLREGFYQ
ncbi:SRPBCC domain-containing protein [Nesterenkonia haasae]|uniref:SRPBCC domain-containing protein n=1 Tax=Nesterenkonia haasae TaxID=2587813 RepID=UPI0013912CCD|nr:SRPBCC domain-containing protein [Nesterenkonia haasae]NDK33210.1 ATPase [Nesterenkonia haasae]